MLHFNKPIQIRSMLADIFQDTFAGEGEGGERRRLEATSTATTSTGTFTAQARKSSVF